MKKFVTIDKRSKKEKKAYYASMRKSWGNVNPATTNMADKKQYTRKKKDYLRASDIDEM